MLVGGGLVQRINAAVTCHKYMCLTADPSSVLLGAHVSFCMCISRLSPAPRAEVDTNGLESELFSVHCVSKAR